LKFVATNEYFYRGKSDIFVTNFLTIHKLIAGVTLIKNQILVFPLFKSLLF